MPNKELRTCSSGSWITQHITATILCPVLLLASVSTVLPAQTAPTFTEYPIPTADSFPKFVTAGPDGALWFTEQIANNIGPHYYIRSDYRVPRSNARRPAFRYSRGA